MSDQAVQSIIDALRPLAEKLGTTAGHLWEVLVRQAYVGLIGHVLAMAFGVSVVVWGWRKWRAYEWEADKARSGYHYDDGINAKNLSAIGLGIATIILAGLLCAEIAWIPTRIFNPEYWALRHVLGAVGGGK